MKLSIEKIKKQALCEIVPAKNIEVRVKEILREFVSKLEKNAGKNIKFFIGGSFAKQTTIKKDKYDVDLFVLFPLKEKKISEKLKKILEKAKIKFSLLHGSRDYYSVKIKEIEG